jgi:hypothetical protein
LRTEFPRFRGCQFVRLHLPVQRQSPALVLTTSWSLCFAGSSRAGHQLQQEVAVTSIHAGPGSPAGWRTSLQWTLGSGCGPTLKRSTFSDWAGLWWQSHHLCSPPRLLDWAQILSSKTFSTSRQLRSTRERSPAWSFLVTPSGQCCLSTLSVILRRQLNCCCGLSRSFSLPAPSLFSLRKPVSLLRSCVSSSVSSTFSLSGPKVGSIPIRLSLIRPKQRALSVLPRISCPPVAGTLISRR